MFKKEIKERMRKNREARKNHLDYINICTEARKYSAKYLFNVIDKLRRMRFNDISDYGQELEYLIVLYKYGFKIAKKVSHVRYRNYNRHYS